MGFTCLWIKHDEKYEKISHHQFSATHYGDSCTGIFFLADFLAWSSDSLLFLLSSAGGAVAIVLLLECIF